MSLAKTAIRTYRTAATQGPEQKPQASTPSYSVQISPLAENLARDKDASTKSIRKKK